MFKVFDVSETREYTLKDDKDNPTVWVIGRIDHALWSYIQDKHNEFSVNDLGAEAKGTVKFSLNLRNDDFVRFGLKGWRNLHDKNGNEVVFSTVSVSTGAGNRQGLSERSMEMIRHAITELASEIERFNSVSGEEQKN